MTPDSKRFLHPDAIRRLGRLEIRARHVVEGFMSGMHRSPYFGQSVEFLQHRQYSPGDDLRHVDWKAWAKQDRLYVKQFEEDASLRATLLVDVSGSMQYGSGPLNKYEYAATAAVSLAYLLLKQHDAVGAIAFDDGIRARTPIRSTQAHLAAIVQTLDASRPRHKTDPGGVLRQIAEASSRRGLMIVFSDLVRRRPVDPPRTAASPTARPRRARITHSRRRRTRLSVRRSHAVRRPRVAGLFELQSPGAARGLSRRRPSVCRRAAPRLRTRRRGLHADPHQPPPRRRPGRVSEPAVDEAPRTLRKDCIRRVHLHVWRPLSTTRRSPGTEYSVPSTPIAGCLP